MRFDDIETCMYYMLACTEIKGLGSTHMNVVFINTDHLAPLVPGQHQETSRTLQPRGGEKTTVLPGHHLIDSASDSESQDSAILLDDENSLTDHEPSSDHEPFTITRIFGKGIGVLATRDIKRGERILVEKPLIRHTLDFDVEEVIGKYNQLTGTERSQVSKLCNIRPEKPHPLLGIIWTNSVKISAKSEDYGLFVTISRLNHACAPNTYLTWNSTLNATTVHASNNIREGEEITSSYLNGVASPSIRGKVLARDFDFICDCAQCLVVGEERKQSDERLERISILERRLAIALPVKRPANTSGYPGIRLYGDILELLELYKKEGITSCRPAKAYVYAWRLSCYNGLSRRVIESAECALRIYSSLKGDDHSETIEWRAKLDRAREKSRDLPPSLESLPPEDDEERREWLFMSEERKTMRWAWDSCEGFENSQAIFDCEWVTTRSSRR